MEDVIPVEMVQPWLLALVAAFLTGLLQATKAAVPEKYHRLLPFLAAVLGSVIFVIKGATLEPPISIVDGLLIGTIVGLASSGIYEGIKDVAKMVGKT
ncbi:MAG: hypothetical protein PHH26_05260 [Candidatus Thermoplasmatota archaeon]|nr:hypothetical protein [Candidatus Thermoplasmatota archaeon]